MKMPIEKSNKQSQHMRTSKTGKVYSAGKGLKLPEKKQNNIKVKWKDLVSDKGWESSDAVQIINNTLYGMHVDKDINNIVTADFDFNGKKIFLGKFKNIEQGKAAVIKKINEIESKNASVTPEQQKRQQKIKLLAKKWALQYTDKIEEAISTYGDDYLDKIENFLPIFNDEIEHMKFAYKVNNKTANEIMDKVYTYIEKIGNKILRQ